MSSLASYLGTPKRAFLDPQKREGEFHIYQHVSKKTITTVVRSVE
jgi:hypothetical protein